MPKKPAPQADLPAAGDPAANPKNQVGPATPRSKIKPPLLDRIDRLFADLKDQVEEAPQQVEDGLQPSPQPSESVAPVPAAITPSDASAPAG